MPIYNNLKLSLVSSIFPNATKLIDAQTHQDFESELIDALGALQYRGIVVPTSVPGIMDGPGWVLAKTAGVYANYSGVTLTTGEIAIIRYDGISTWTKDLMVDTSVLGAFQTASNTATIDLTLSGGGDLTADAKLSATAGNDLEADGTGLYINVQTSPVDDNEDLLGLGAGTAVPLINLLDEIAVRVTTPSPWTRTGTNVYPTTLTDFIGINNNTPAKQLDVVGRMNLSLDSTYSIMINGGNDSATGLSNILLGFDAGLGLTTGGFNVMTGGDAGKNTTTGIGNVFQGRQSGWSNVTGSYNVYGGYFAGQQALGSNNIFFGRYAGYLETESSKFFINSAIPTTETEGRDMALLYGVMSQTTANQKLYANSQLYLPLYGDGTITGTATKLLAVDVDGKVIESDLVVGSSSPWQRTGTNTHLLNIGDNVGIGTETPSSKLSIGATTSGAALTNNFVWVTGAGGSSPTVLQNRISLGLNNNQDYGAYFGELNLDYSTGQVGVLGTRAGAVDFPALYVRGGSVGVGTNTPSSKLQVNGGNITVVNPIGESVYLGESASSTAGFIMNRNYSYSQSQFILRNSASQMSMLFNVNGAYWDIPKPIIVRNNAGAIFQTHQLSENGSRIFFNSAGAEGMRWSSTDSRLGIGTTTPTQALHVVGNARVTGAIYDSANSAGTSGQVLSTTGTGTSWITNPVSPFTRTGTNVTLTNTGDNVGIGITPTAKLQVNGTFKISNGISASNFDFGYSTLNMKSATGSPGSTVNFQSAAGVTFASLIDGVGMELTGVHKMFNGTSQIQAIGKTTTGAGLLLGNASWSRIATASPVVVGSETLTSCAVLEATSSDKGFLPPRMLGAFVESISSPIAGLLAYATDGSGATVNSTGLWMYNGSTWIKIS